MDLALCTEVCEHHTDLVLQPKSLSFSVRSHDMGYVRICTNTDTNDDIALIQWTYVMFSAEWLIPESPRPLDIDKHTDVFEIILFKCCVSSMVFIIWFCNYHLALWLSIVYYTGVHSLTVVVNVTCQLWASHSW